MNLPTAALVILGGITVAFWQVPDPPLRFDQRFAPAQQLMEPKKERELTFEERWEPVKQLPRMLLPETQDIGPRVVLVKTTPIRAEPAVYVEPEVSSDNSGQSRPSAVSAAPLPREHPKARTIRKASLDLCQRHGMVKQITRGGKSWRCRR